MKNFANPEIEIVKFEMEDVMTASEDDFVPGDNETGMT